MTSTNEAATVAVDDFGSPEAFMAAVDATIKYFNLTPDGVPRFPYVVAIRDYE